MKKVIVTGATGFLGKYLVAELVKNNFEVVALGRKVPDTSRMPGITFQPGDIEDPFSLRESFIHADVVVHAAGLISADPADDKRMYQTNVLGTRNVVNACLSAGIKRLIYVSSVAALNGNNIANESPEQVFWGGPNTGYGYTKYKGGLEVRKGEAEGLEVSIVHPSVIFGPGDSDRSSGKILKLIRAGMPFAPEGVVNGVDARDVAQMVVRLANGEGTGQHFVLSGFTMNWKEFFSRVSNGYGRSTRIVTIPTRVLIMVVWCYEMVCRLIRIRPYITINAIKMATSGNSYESQFVTMQLGFSFRSPEETLNWVFTNGGVEISQIKQN